MNFPLIANVVVLSHCCCCWRKRVTSSGVWQKKYWPVSGLGVVFGLALQAIYGSDNPVLKNSIQWFNVVGNGYVQLLQMIVMPLVFALF